MAHNTRKAAVLQPASSNTIAPEDQLKALQIRIDEQESHYSQLISSSMDDLNNKILDLQQDHQQAMESLLHDQDSLRTESQRNQLLIEELKMENQKSVTYLASLIQGISLNSIPPQEIIPPVAPSPFLKGKETMLHPHTSPKEDKGLLPTPAEKYYHHLPFPETYPQLNHQKSINSPTPDPNNMAFAYHPPQSHPHYHTQHHLHPPCQMQIPHHNHNQTPFFSQLLPKYVLPSFDGTDCSFWISKCQIFFQIYEIPPTMIIYFHSYLLLF